MKLSLKFFLLVSVVLQYAVVLAKSPEADNTHVAPALNKIALKEWKFFDGNTIQCTINSAGPYCDELRTSAAGLFWPKGTNKTAVFTAGLWVIGVHRPTGQLRTAVEDYQTEFQPGPILSTFNTTTNDPSVAGNPDDQKYHIYKVNKSDANLPAGSRNPDYDNWPGDLGAPYIDVDGNGQWTPGVDKPKLYGDQELWCVYNDANEANHTKTGVTAPMGIEVQVTYFGFDQPGALGNIMFMRWKVINKSDADYDSVFVSMWADTDLGDANDDLIACDTIRNLSYVYNGDNDDGTAVGYGSKPPSDGFVFFEGPQVPGNPGDSAIAYGVWRHGYRNLGAYSADAYFNGSTTYPDPPLGSALFAKEAYEYQNGIDGGTHLPYLDPVTGKPSKFAFPGDPVTESGWTMTKSGLSPEDVRGMISAGPFTLAKGDTQEIVGAFVIAQGADRLGSVTLLRRYVDVAQEAFNRNFAVASPPPAPIVDVADLPNKIVLSWGDPAKYDTTEDFNFVGAAKNYKFEGYNIYQLSSNSATADATRIATYDLVDGVKIVVDAVNDPTTGLILQEPVEFGSDSGIKRSITIDKDYLTGDPIVDGKQYYFSVTSYAFNFDSTGVGSGIPQTLENSKSPILVIPRQTPVGDLLGTSSGQDLLTDRAVHGDDAIVPQVVNPRDVIPAIYSVTFNGSGSTVTSWNLQRSGGGASPLTLNAVTDLSGDDASPIVDGIMFRVKQPTPGLRLDTQTPPAYSYAPNQNLWFDGVNDSTVYKMDAFHGGIAYPVAGNFLSKATSLADTLLQKVEIRFSASTTQKAYRYLSKVKTVPPQPIADPSFIPYIINKGVGFQYQDYVTVPFTVWEIDSLDGSFAPRQLNVGFVENNDSLYSASGKYLGNGHIDGKWDPTPGANGGGELLFIFASTYDPNPETKYSKSPTDTTKNMDIQTNFNKVDVMYALDLKTSDTTATFHEGDKFDITPNYPLTLNSAFSLIPPATVTGSTQLAKQDISRINVFPNPYFAHNKAETSIYLRFVTFENLPSVATIRIFDLAGELLRTIQHSNTTGFEQWDLLNNSGLPVASGMYIAYIDIPNVGNRILKLAIIQPDERPSKL
ncbi:MAG TPA: T9SS type A sorting domain-containing protein [Bacteroidota bacterium]|nr:T9SS type A sorting domain-containing protein [Bacteroidota bacterium]